MLWLLCLDARPETALTMLLWLLLWLKWCRLRMFLQSSRTSSSWTSVVFTIEQLEMNYIPTDNWALLLYQVS
jgi:hypothetical protein